MLDRWCSPSAAACCSWAMLATFIEPAALCAAGSNYVRKRLREERGFAKQRLGRDGAAWIRRRQFDLGSLACLCADECWIQLQLWVLNRSRKEPFEVGRRMLPSL